MKGGERKRVNELSANGLSGVYLPGGRNVWKSREADPYEFGGID